jgi:hypothetical protein
MLGAEGNRDPSHGLPEADLTDEEREAAVARIKQEESLRRAARPVIEADMAGITKVGPPDKDDLPRKKGFLHSVLRFFHVMTGLAWVSRMFLFMPARSAGRAIELMTKDDEPGAHYHPPPGIPEADLTEDEREAAVRRIQQDQAIRKARGE